MPKPVKKKRAKLTSQPADVNQWARQLVDETTADPKPDAPLAIPPAALSAYMSALGRKGGEISGKRRMRNLSPEARQEIASKAARKRWAKHRKRG
jgi:hypothetical protein